MHTTREASGPQEWPSTGFHWGPDLAGSRNEGWQAVGQYSIVGSVRELALVPSLPALTAHVALGPRVVEGRHLGRPIEGTGVSTDPRTSRLAAIAEVVERYCAVQPPAPGLLVRASSEALGRSAVPPSAFSLLSARQYVSIPALRPLRGDTVTDWCPGFSLTHDRGAWVPAALCYLSLDRRPPNDFLAESTTTGMACHVSLASAVHAALCEVLERDALAIVWHNGLKARRLETAGTVLSDLVATGDGDCRFELYELPTDSPYPVVVCLAGASCGSPGAAVGAGCRPDHVGAAVRALCEAAQVFSRLSAHPPQPPRQVRTFADHAALYAQPGPARLLRGLLGGGSVAALADMPARSARPPSHALGWLVDRLAEVGMEVVVLDMTPPDVRLAGLHVVRVVVPGLLDVNADARYPRLGGRRLYELPVALGLRGAPAAEHELNRLPIPLA
ncbi:MAG: YcaO-like family protein [Acidimicrobiales bacterium]